MLLRYLLRVYIGELLQVIDCHFMKEMIRTTPFFIRRHDLDEFQKN